MSVRLFVSLSICPSNLFVYNRSDKFLFIINMTVARFQCHQVVILRNISVCQALFAWVLMAMNGTRKTTWRILRLVFTPVCRPCCARIPKVVPLKLFKMWYPVLPQMLPRLLHGCFLERLKCMLGVYSWVGSAPQNWPFLACDFSVAWEGLP